MNFIYFYSKKILSGRQRIILYGSVIICIMAFCYTYLAIEYICTTMLNSIADMSPHIRVFVTSPDLAKKIIDENKHIAQRIGTGIVAEKNFYIQTRKLATEIGKPGEIFFTGIKKIKLVGYPFDNENYRPPVLLENTYSKANRDLAERRPADEPIRIITDPDEREQKENWVIISKDLTSIFPLGPSQFGDVFELLTTDSSGKQSCIHFRTAGYLSGDPITISSGGNNIIYAKNSLIEKITAPEDRRLVVDISLNDSLSADQISKDLLNRYPEITTETWIELNPAALPFLNGLRITALFGVSTIVLLSIIGISILIYMLILEKSKQIAILFAMGYNTTQLRFIFLYIGLRVAFYGVLIGGLGGYFLAQCSLPYWYDIVANFSSAVGHSLVFSFHTILGAVVITFVLCLVAAWLPTRSIVSSDPIVNLRNE